MGTMIESCKHSINCCDDDEDGYVERNYTGKISSDQDSNDEDDFTEFDEKPTEPPMVEAPTDFNNIKIKPNNLFMKDINLLGNFMKN